MFSTKVEGTIQSLGLAISFQVIYPTEMSTSDKYKCASNSFIYNHLPAINGSECSLPVKTHDPNEP